MSKKTHQKIGELLDTAIELGKKEFGQVYSVRYSCPVVDEDGYRCSDSTKPPLPLHNEYCPKHGKRIEEYQTTAYDSQPWQEAFQEYFYQGKFEDNK